jgi:hypothetical protein
MRWRFDQLTITLRAFGRAGVPSRVVALCSQCAPGAIVDSAIAARLAGCVAVNSKSARQASDIKIQTLLAVMYVERGETIRLISAREATRRERKYYEERTH